MVGHDGHGSVVLDLLQTNTASSGSHTRVDESFESQRVAKQPRVQEPTLHEGGLERLVMRMHGTHTVAKWSARYLDEQNATCTHGRSCMRAHMNEK